MKKMKDRNIEGKIEFIIDFCERCGISISIDRNPSPEKIEKIKASIKRREDLEKTLVERYKKES